MKEYFKRSSFMLSHIFLGSNIKRSSSLMFLTSTQLGINVYKIFTKHTSPSFQDTKEDLLV